MTDTVSYAKSLDANVERAYVKCFNCNKSSPKSWIIINNDGILKDSDTVKYPDELHYCSRNCYNNKTVCLPKNAWEYLQNKSDFNEPRPTPPVQKKQFQFLSFMEIRTMTDEERDKYYDNMEEYASYSLESSIYMDEYQEDKRTFELENELDDYYSDENEYDDHE